MKKIFAIMLALVLVLAMGASAMAETTTTTGSITIQNAAMGETYTVVKLFSATTTADGKIAYTGTIPDNLTGYFTKDAAGNISATDAAKKSSSDLSDEAIAALKTWAEANKDDSSIATSKTGTGGALVFDGLAFGYYVILSSQGAAITVDSTNPNATVYDKNVTAPANNLTKSVDDRDVMIGQTVTYTVTFKAPNYDGTTLIEEYVIHDTLPDFLTNVTVTSIIVDEDGNTETTTDQHDVTAQFDSNKKITLNWVNIDSEGNKTSKYSNSAVVILTYTATVTDNAVAGSSGNTNTVTVTWTGDEDGNTDTETIYTYSVDIVKTDAAGVLLDGAEFKLYSDAVCTDEISLILDQGAGAYRPVLSGETAASSIVVSGGKVTITGLASGTYYLKETKAPDGYNLLATATMITINGANLEANTDVNGETQVEVYVSGGIQVVNQAGTELPSTGGIGTTIFYVVGGLLMAAAVVLLVTKKKVSSK